MGLSANPAPSGPPLRSGFVRRVGPRLVASLVTAGGFAWAMNHGGLPLMPPRGSLSGLSWQAMAAAFACMLAAIYFRTARWIHLLRPIAAKVAARPIFAIGLLGGAATFFAPFRLGEVVRPYMLANETKQVTFTQALGTVAAERVLDGLLVVVLTTASLAASTPVRPLPDHVGSLPIPTSLVPAALLSATVLFTVALVGMVALYLLRDRAGAWVRSSVGRVVPSLGERLARTVQRLSLGFAFLSSWRHVVGVLGHTMLFWLGSLSSTWIFLVGVGLSPTPAQACMIGGLMSLGSILPSGPGFFGAYQVAAYTALAMYYAPAQVVSQGALFVFVGYVGLVALNVVSAAAGFALMPRSR
jgi:glycosyltransferase 2 family protein